MSTDEAYFFLIDVRKDKIECKTLLVTGLNVILPSLYVEIHI